MFSNQTNNVVEGHLLLFLLWSLEKLDEMSWRSRLKYQKTEIFSPTFSLVLFFSKFLELVVTIVFSLIVFELIFLDTMTNHTECPMKEHVVVKKAGNGPSRRPAQG